MRASLQGAEGFEEDEGGDADGAGAEATEDDGGLGAPEGSDEAGLEVAAA